MAAVLKRSFLGIEIGPETASAVLCQTQRGEAQIVAAHRVERSAQDTEAESLAAVLGPVSSHDAALTATCALALPAGQFIFRPLTAPFEDDRKLRQVLPFELEPSLVAAAEEMVFDHRRLDSGPPRRILAAAIEKSRLAGLLESLGALRLDPEWVTAGGICPALCLMDGQGEAERFIAAALRPHGATLVPVAGGRLLAVRDICVPLHTEAGCRTLIALLKQTCRALADADGNPFRPRQIRLTGYGPYSEAFEALATEHLDLAVERVDLSRGRHLTAQALRDWEPGIMNGALALALSARRADTGFNLRQGDFAVKKFWTRHRRQFQRTAVLTAVVFVLGAAQLAHGVYLKQRRIEQITQETAALFRATRPDATRVVDPVSQMRAVIKELESTTKIPGSEGARPRAIDILAALSREIPAGLDVEITRLVIGTDNLTLTGHTATFNAVDEIKTRLEKNPMLRQVTIAAANIDNRSNRVRFTLNIGRLEVVPWPSN